MAEILLLDTNQIAACDSYRHRNCFGDGRKISTLTSLLKRGVDVNLPYVGLYSIPIQFQIGKPFVSFDGHRRTIAHRRANRKIWCVLFKSEEYIDHRKWKFSLVPNYETGEDYNGIELYNRVIEAYKEINFVF
ncbi:MAG: hypothetical protein KC589_05825 [Nanoarchaeota archaeon]|nr:hypothetical protein [Nanoarchaeota archaeon]MCA9496436.1 hypothetical protein [Nanoarchaeota archaeon]